MATRRFPSEGRYIHFASPAERRRLDLNRVMVSPSSPGSVFPGSLYSSEPFPVPPAVAPPSGFWGSRPPVSPLQRNADGSFRSSPLSGPRPSTFREGFELLPVSRSDRPTGKPGTSARFDAIRKGERTIFDGIPTVAPPDQAQKWMPRDTSTAYLVGLEREDWSSGVEAPHPPHFSRYSRPRGWFGGVVDGVWPAGNIKVEDGCLPQRQPRDMALPEMYAPKYLAGNASQMMKLTAEGIALAPRMSFGVVIDRTCDAPRPSEGNTSSCCPNEG